MLYVHKIHISVSCDDILVKVLRLQNEKCLPKKSGQSFRGARENESHFQNDIIKCNATYLDHFILHILGTFCWAYLLTCLGST